MLSLFELNPLDILFPFIFGILSGSIGAVDLGEADQILVDIQIEMIFSSRRDYRARRPDHRIEPLVAYRVVGRNQYCLLYR